MSKRKPIKKKTFFYLFPLLTYVHCLKCSRSAVQTKSFLVIIWNVQVSTTTGYFQAKVSVKYDSAQVC